MKKLFTPLKKVLDKLTNKNNLHPELYLVDWEQAFYESLKRNGFVIKDKIGFDNKNRTPDGIYSSKYGSSWGDADAFAEKHSCKCRKIYGRKYIGTVCDECKTKVKFRDTDLKIFGWLVLENHHVIHPLMYKTIRSVFKTKNLSFEDIISYERAAGSDGVYDDDMDDQITSDLPIEVKYKNIGLVAFYENFDYILEDFITHKKTKSNSYKRLIAFIKKNRDIIFVSKIPVYTTFLRPVIVSGEDTNFVQENKKFQSLSSRVYRLNEGVASLKDELQTLYRTQKVLIEIYDIILASLSGKKGDIRSKILGSRFNFTARCVIIPYSNCKINELAVSYRAFLELYKPEIINLLVKFDKITYSKALERWNEALLEFNPKVYEIMQYLLNNTKDGLYIQIDRNPTIVYGSMLCMRIKEITKDIDNFCLAVPINILAFIKGDYDGDVINMLALKGRETINRYNARYNPRTNMQISRKTGFYNTDSSLKRDQLLTMNIFNAL